MLLRAALRTTAAVTSAARTHTAPLHIITGPPSNLFAAADRVARLRRCPPVCTRMAAAAAAEGSSGEGLLWQILADFAAADTADASLALTPFSSDACPRYSLVHRLEHDWYCYWSEDYGVPKDKAANYCFRPPLQLTRLGVVLPGTVLSSLASEEGRQGCRQAQVQARAAAFPGGEPLIMDGMGSEGSEPVEPFVSTLPRGWESRDFTESKDEARAFFGDLLQHMGAHEQLLAVIQAYVGALNEVPQALLHAEDEEEGTDGGQGEGGDARRLLTGLFKARNCQGQGQSGARAAFGAAMGRCAWAVVGEEQLNPVLVLVVRRVGGAEGAGGGWLAGVMTGVIYT